jgi:hypothetical protein
MALAVASQVIDEAKGIACGVTAAPKGIDQVDAAYTKLRTDAMTISASL